MATSIALKTLNPELKSRFAVCVVFVIFVRNVTTLVGATNWPTGS